MKVMKDFENQKVKDTSSDSLMNLQHLNDIFKARLSDEDFKKLSEFIYRGYGIKMPEVKRIMLQSRLQKRLKELKMSSFKEYVQYVFSDEGQENEVIHMIDVVSTNKTDFFREPIHFDFLTSQALPEFMAGATSPRLIKIWSAGCSSGEEPYTIAIVLQEFKNRNPLIDYRITATDISTRILRSAVDAIYKENRIEGIPLNMKRQYFLKSKDRVAPTVRVIPELRQRVSFERLNFMDNSYSISETFDIVFCRNVLIYFDRETQEKVINKLCSKLRPGGIFFLGHSESITSLNVPLTQIKPTIFRRN
jgi:chemotaxis protein methyltransferase CheR